MLDRLEATIRQRMTADPATSYTAKLAADPAFAARKLGEEAVELVVASLAQDRSVVVKEAADVLFHLVALLAIKDVPLSEVAAELTRREGVSGLDEKASR
ncbi:Phosphoribosyl-ATP pyrophosphatase [Sphingomonas antarctica]|uniref:phosphoribosyl-ATP diphosphatase n=1 Tax=Sphingomonas antarctica TaxID=2040274 RepID=UPI0039E7BFC9